MIAMSSGLFIVPLYALMQDHAEPSRVSRVIAANNIVNALFMVAGAGIVAVAQGKGAGVPVILLALGLLNLLVVVASFWLVRGLLCEEPKMSGVVLSKKVFFRRFWSFYGRLSGPFPVSVFFSQTAHHNGK